MREIRDLIAEYFSNKALDAMDRLCDEGKLSDDKIESWHFEHLRTPYNYKQSLPLYTRKHGVYDA